MRIAVAQSRPIIGPVERNLPGHQKLVDLAVRHQSQLVVFPELSLTGYEPSRAAEFARSETDACFDSFQSICDRNDIAIGAGVPTPGAEHPYISLLLFLPSARRTLYSKQHLHPDEFPFFAPGQESDGVIRGELTVALAICYELSISRHADDASKAGAVAYIASVAKTSRGVDSASQRLSEIAYKYSMVVFMANCLGMADGVECVRSISRLGSQRKPCCNAGRSQ